MIDTLYLLLYTLPLSIAFMTFECTGIELSSPTFATFILSVFIPSCLIVFKKGNTAFKVSCVVILVLLVGRFLFSLFPNGNPDFILSNLKYIWISLLSLFAFGLGLLMIRFRFFRILTAIGLIAYLITMLSLNLLVNASGIALMFFQCTVILAEETQLHWKKEGYTDHKKHLVYISPFLLAGLLMALIIKSPDDPYSWNFVRKIVTYFRSGGSKVTQMLFYNTRDDFEDDLLNLKNIDEINNYSNIEPADVMELKNGYNGEKIIYLDGKIYDSPSKEFHKEAVGLDVLETLSAAIQYREGHPQDILKSVILELKFKMYKTGYVFSPLKTLSVKLLDGKTKINGTGGQILFDKKMGYDTHYQVEYFMLNSRHPEFRKFACREYQTTPELWEKLRLTYHLEYDPEYSFEKFLEHREAIYKNYTQTEEVPERIIKMISEELSEYNLSLEKGQFLLDRKRTYDKLKLLEACLWNTPVEKTGYHPAVLFKMLARSQGIPVRLVQGFVVPIKDQRSITVKSNMIHIWPEAYLDNIGWIPFEPFGGFGSGSSWTLFDEDPTTSFELPEEYYPYPLPEALPEEDYVPYSKPETKSNNLYWVIIGGSLFIIILSIVLIIPLTLLVLHHKYKKAAAEEKLRIICKRNLKILHFIGFDIKTDETLTEFSGRATESIENPGDCFLFIKHYEYLLYSEKKITEKMIVDSRKSTRTLLALLKNEKPKLYFVYFLRSFQ